MIDQHITIPIYDRTADRVGAVARDVGAIDATQERIPQGGLDLGGPSGNDGVAKFQSLTASVIAAGAISAYLVAGNTITTRTGGTGAGFTVDQFAIKAYNASNQNLATIDGATGLISAVGYFQINPTDGGGTSTAPWQTTGWIPGGGNMLFDASLEERAGNGLSLTSASLQAPNQPVGVFYPVRWDASNCSAVTATSNAFHGGQAALITNNSGATNNLFFSQPTSTTGMAVPAGKRMTFSFYAKPGTFTGNIKALIKWYQASGAASAVRASDSSALVALVAGQHVRALVSADVPSDAAFAIVQASGDAVPNGQTIYMDGMQFEVGDVATAFATRSDEIYAYSITAGYISVGSLSAISANMGTVTAGTLTGVLIQTGAGAQTRTYMDSTGIYITDSGGSTKIASLTQASVLKLSTTSTTYNTPNSIEWHDANLSGALVSSITGFKSGSNVAGAWKTVDPANSSNFSELGLTIGVVSNYATGASLQSVVGGFMVSRVEANSTSVILTAQASGNPFTTWTVFNGLCGSSGGVSAGGAAGGSSVAGYTFYDRVAATNPSSWVWYANNAVARLWNSRKGDQYLADGTSGGLLAHVLNGADDQNMGVALIRSQMSSGYTGHVCEASITPQAAGTGFTLFTGTANGVNKFHVRGDGQLFATFTTITAISDRKLKRDVQDLRYAGDVIDGLRPVEFDWDPHAGAERSGHDYGFVAQEAEVVVPHLVDRVKVREYGEDFKTFAPGGLIPHLVATVQDLRARVAELEHERLMEAVR